MITRALHNYGLISNYRDYLQLPAGIMEDVLLLESVPDARAR